MRRQRMLGSSVLYAVVLTPILLLSLALAVDVGALQLTRQRLGNAVDQAAVVAVAGTTVSASGVRLDAASEQRLRAALIENLRPLQADIVGESADAVAADADVALVSEVPAADPFDPSTELLRPTLVVRARVPVSTGLLHVAGLPPVVTLTLHAGADLRVTGGGST